MDCNINGNCLAILKYEDMNFPNRLTLDYVEFSNSFSAELQYFNDYFTYDEQSTYSIIDIEKLQEYFINNVRLNQLNMNYKYCESLDGRFEGFTVDLKKDISNFSSLIEIIKTNIFNINLTKIHQDEFGTLKHNFNTIFQELSDSNIREDNDLVELKQDMDINIWVNSISKIILMSYSQRIILWTKAFSIQKKYRECYNNKEILFFSHRINGWASPVCNLNKELSAEYKTNFGYGHSSYFYVKLTFKDIEIIPFSDLIRYRTAGFFEINQYTRKYELKNDEWKPALIFLVDAFNLLIENEKDFIKKHMIDEVKTLLIGLGELMENEHFSFEDDPKSEPKYDKETGEIIPVKIDPIDITILRAKKITNSLDFISKIKEYNYVSEIDSAIIQIESFNSNIKHILVNEFNKLKNIITNLQNKISDLQPRFHDLKTIDDEYLQKRKKLKKETNLNEYNIDLMEEIFQKQYPEYIKFIEEFNPVKKRFMELNNEYNNTKHILKELESYYNKIIHYFNNK